MVKVRYNTTEFIIKVSVHPIDKGTLLECLRGMGKGLDEKRGHGERGKGGNIQLDEMERAPAFQIKRDEQGMVKEDEATRRSEEAMGDVIKQNMKRRTSETEFIKLYNKPRV